MSRRNKDKKKKKTRGGWIATLKDGSTAFVRFMRQESEEIETLTKMAHILFDKVKEATGGRETLEFLEKMGIGNGEDGFKEELIRTGRSRILVAEVDGEIVSFLEVSRPMNEDEINLMSDEELKRDIVGTWRIRNSYTKKDYRLRGINMCLKLIAIRRRAERIFQIPLTKDVGEELKASYERLVKKIDMELKIMPSKDEEHTYTLFITKKRNTNELIEKLLKKDFKVDY